MIYVKTATKEDLPLIEKWLGKDEFHQQIGIKAEDLLEDGCEAAIIHDENGPVMAVRFHKALRAAVQFNPDAKYRSAKIGAEVAEWFQDLAKQGGMKEVIIRPGGKAVRFVEKLGFKDFIGKFLGV